MNVGTIISTYNQPRWLELTLEGWVHQTRTPDLIVIADDGSDSRTANIIHAFASRLPLHHVWHEDKGFRKTDILNKAIEFIMKKGKIDYVVFTDGDCIPRNDFLESHIRHAAHGRFLSGGYHKLPRFTSETITPSSIATQQCFDPRWLKTNGMSMSVRNSKLIVKGLFAKIFDAITTTRPTFNGHNASAWMSDIIRANGFDTRMKYGGEDRELGERLENASVKGHGIRYQAICLHLDHDRSYINLDDTIENNRIRQETKSLRSTVTQFGLESNLPTL